MLCLNNSIPLRVKYRGRLRYRLGVIQDSSCLFMNVDRRGVRWHLIEYGQSDDGAVAVEETLDAIDLHH
jgi:hypothetical protein